MIRFHEKERAFHLKNDSFSVVIHLTPNDIGDIEPMMTYYGAPLPDGCLPEMRTDWMPHSSNDSMRSKAPFCVPTEGRGDYRPNMVCAADEAGYSTTELYYVSYTIEAGKPVLEGLPATYTEQPEEAETLTLLLRDPLTKLEAEMCYTVFADYPALASSLRLTNKGEQTLTLKQAGSFALNLEGEWDMLHLHGAWTRERYPERVPACTLTRVIESVRGASGQEHNPFVALMKKDATEFIGEVYGVNLVYSGDFRVSVDGNLFDKTRLVTGLNPRSFSWKLVPGDSFQTPEAICVYSREGLNGMSHGFHELFRKRLCRGEWRDKERPILINNWEATYFGFNHDKLMDIARVGADVGLELFVLDDGWFGHRDSDNSSLGDWVVDKNKLPRGLKALGDDINALGLRFGLWFEPEMVSPDSDLYRAHPDWCIHVPGRRRTEARNQLVLDMSRKDVQDYIIKSVCDVLGSAPIGYVKWDMNRHFMEAGSCLLQDGREGELAHRYMLGVYRVMDAITGSFPDVLFESCASGGARFDAGLLFYMPQTWTSDDTDAIERLKIQYGTSIAYPACAMGAHVSAVPNHQVGRVTPIKTRGDVAIGGNFGYELDLSKQTPEDLEDIRRQVKLVKRIRSTTQKGVFTRLRSPFEGNLTAWQFVDEKRVVLCVYQTLGKPNTEPERIFPRDLPADAVYQTDDGKQYPAPLLMQFGIVCPTRNADFSSSVLVFERLN